jgi:hypothetical protein
MAWMEFHVTYIIKSELCSKPSRVDRIMGPFSTALSTRGLKMVKLEVATQQTPDLVLPSNNEHDV